MRQFAWKVMLKPLLAVIAFAGTMVTLVSGIPEISKNPIGQAFLVLLGICSFVYLAYFVYASFYRKYLRMAECLKQIAELISKFTVANANIPVACEIDPDLINLIIATRRMASISLKVIDFTPQPNNHIQIIIDKGFGDGIRDGMQFKVFHNQQWAEIGACGCTATFTQTTLDVPISPNCPIKPSDLRRDDIEVRLVEPIDNCKFNQLIASIQHKLSHM